MRRATPTRPIEDARAPLSALLGTWRPLRNDPDAAQLVRGFALTTAALATASHVFVLTTCARGRAATELTTGRAAVLGAQRTDDGFAVRLVLSPLVACDGRRRRRLTAEIAARGRGAATLRLVVREAARVVAVADLVRESA